MRLRPARSMRYISSQAWARYSIKKPRKNYVKALPHTSLLVFNMGKDAGAFDTIATLSSNQYVQIRSNALEAARQVANKHLERELPGNYFMKVLTYPHSVVREKKMAMGAGADRISKGMTLSFGKASMVAARIKKNQNVFIVKVKADKTNVAKEALKRASSKLSGTYKINIERKVAA
jgi:large subunit ribosomal protein L10e